MQPENAHLTESEIRTMLFGLNMKLPAYYEMRTNLDQQIRSINSEIAALNIRLSALNGNIDAPTIANYRRRQPRAIEAAKDVEEVPTIGMVHEKEKRRYNVREEDRKKLSESRRRYWANLTPRAKAALIRRQAAGRRENKARRAAV